MSAQSPSLVNKGTPTAVPKGRLLILLGGGVGLIAGLLAALLRLGVMTPEGSAALASSHGILMAYGFVGTAISLERAVAVQAGRGRLARLAYLMPSLSGIAVLLTLVQAGGIIPALPSDGRLLPGMAWTAAMAMMCGIYVLLYRRGPAPAILIQLLGAAAGLVGILLWTRGLEIAVIFPWWAAFLILTIVGERVELARVAFLRPGLEARILAEALALLLALVVMLYVPAVGYPLAGAVLAVLIADVTTHDIARRTIHAEGLTKFMAACMLSGYAWLAIPAGVWMLSGPVYSGYGYDTVVHAITIGFVLSMIMAHAPVIVPAIIRREVPYHPAMWAVWALVELSLLIRVASGLRGVEIGWQFGGTLGVVGILAFVLTTVTLVIRGGRPR